MTLPRGLGAFAGVGVKASVPLHPDIGGALVGAEPVGEVLFLEGLWAVAALSHADSIGWKRQRVNKSIDKWIR